MRKNGLNFDEKEFVYQHLPALQQNINECFSQALLDNLAKKSNFLIRKGKVNTYNFVNSLMFSEMGQDQLSLLDLKQDLSQQFNCDVSRTALHKRFNSNTVRFLKELLYHQFSTHTLKNIHSDSFLKEFNRVNIKDSTKFTLPGVLAHFYPGYGGFNMSSGLMNIQYEYDLKSGKWLCLELTKANRNDQQDSKETIESIQCGDLLIRDLGYVTMPYMKGVIEKQAYFLNRLPTNTRVFKRNKDKYQDINWNKIDKKLKENSLKRLDINVFLGKVEKIPVRLIIEKVADQIYTQRIRKATKKAKKNKHQLSQEYKIRCKYNVFVTNASEETIPARTIIDVYKLRWQIEIIFKTWKSVLSIHKTKKIKKERFESQLLAKMLWVLLNWKFFQTANNYIQKQDPRKGCSNFQFFKQIKKYSMEIRLVILGILNLKEWISNRFIKLIIDCLTEVKKGKISIYQRINLIHNGLG